MTTTYLICHGAIRRLVPIWHSISTAGHTAIVVVADPGLNRILLGHVLNLPIDEMLRLDQDAGCVNIIERNGTRPWVRLINGTPRRPHPRKRLRHRAPGAVPPRLTFAALHGEHACKSADLVGRRFGWLAKSYCQACL